MRPRADVSGVTSESGIAARCIALVFSLFSLACSGAGGSECAHSDPLRCRVEASDDPELQKKLAPLLEPSNAAQATASDHH